EADAETARGGHDPGNINARITTSGNQAGTTATGGGGTGGAHRTAPDCHLYSLELAMVPMAFLQSQLLHEHVRSTNPQTHTHTHTHICAIPVAVHPCPANVAAVITSLASRPFP